MCVGNNSESHMAEPRRQNQIWFFFFFVIASCIREPIPPGRMPRNLTKSSVEKSESFSIRQTPCLLGDVMQTVLCTLWKKDRRWAGRCGVIKLETVKVRWQPSPTSKPVGCFFIVWNEAVVALQVGAWVQVGVHVSSSAPKCRQHDPIVWFCSLKPLAYSPVWSGEGDAYSSLQKLHVRLHLHCWVYINFVVLPGDSPFLWLWLVQQSTWCRQPHQLAPGSFSGQSSGASGV